MAVSKLDKFHLNPEIQLVNSSYCIAVYIYGSNSLGITLGTLYISFRPLTRKIYLEKIRILWSTVRFEAPSDTALSRS